MTPKTFTTNDFLALASAPTAAKPFVLATELAVKVYNYSGWKWETTTDAELIDTAIEAAMPNLHMNIIIGERVFLGDLLGKRVCVEGKA